MPGAEYEVTCTACILPRNAFAAIHPDDDDIDGPATLDEFFGELGGEACRYCPECGYVGTQEHSFQIVCADCGRRGAQDVSMFDAPDRCGCGGEQNAQSITGRAPRCPEHPAIDLLEMSLIDLQATNGGVTTIPCHVCQRGTFVIGDTTTLSD